MASTSSRELKTRCCIVGGGPAGIVLGLLLARAGVPVTVLEKHKDFLRDFRGDTVHPSTLELLRDLGLLEKFLALPHRQEETLVGQFADGLLTIGDFRGLKPFPYMALAPQWDFLDMLVKESKRYPSYTLLMRTEGTALLRERGRVIGVQAQGPDGPLTVRADLVVGTDGRHSTLREAAHLKPRDFGAPMDVLWFRLSRKPDDIDHTYGIVGLGSMMVLLNRNDYWQAGFIIPKGSGEAHRQNPVAEFRAEIAKLAPFLSARTSEIKSWEDVSLLTVTVDRLDRWHQPGLLLIGDAAHAMSPMGGVGINLAIQDAVATANIVGPALRDGKAIDERLLAQVQSRRMLPTRVIQGVQRIMQRAIIQRVLDAQGPPPRMPKVMKFLFQFRWMRRIPARLFGFGFRCERLRLPAVGR
ncbi:MAG TPA: FAD-dependent oxidoreductase [Gammaproteobacteria bacterium]|jgi:2-polyprenyl-6-methoxyphenol hydroxylase-like FAD-dependent oxidoreductase